MKKLRNKTLGLKEVLKKLQYKLQFWDGIWSIPASFLFFVAASVLSTKYFGEPLFAMGFLQPVFLAALVLIVANFIVMLGMYFNARSLQRFFYSMEIKERVKNELSTWQRIKLYLFYYFGLLLVFLILVTLFMIV